MDADIKWLDDPETFRVNQLPAHSDHRYYGDYAEWAHHRSRFVQSLDGQWQFQFAPNPHGRRTSLPLTTTQPTLARLRCRVKLSSVTTPRTITLTP